MDLQSLALFVEMIAYHSHLLMGVFRSVRKAFNVRLYHVTLGLNWASLTRKTFWIFTSIALFCNGFASASIKFRKSVFISFNACFEILFCIIVKSGHIGICIKSELGSGSAISFNASFISFFQYSNEPLYSSNVINCNGVGIGDIFAN